MLLAVSQCTWPEIVWFYGQKREHAKTSQYNFGENPLKMNSVQPREDDPLGRAVPAVVVLFPLQLSSPKALGCWGQHAAPECCLVVPGCLPLCCQTGGWVPGAFFGKLVGPQLAPSVLSSCLLCSLLSALAPHQPPGTTPRLLPSSRDHGQKADAACQGGLSGFYQVLIAGSFTPNE